MAETHADTVAVITGGAQGIGRAIAEALIAGGCRRIVIAGRTRATGEAAAEALRVRGADARFVAADMARVEDARGLIDRAAGMFGKVDALVNAAASSERGSILDTDPDLWDRLFATNARGPFFALQRMAQRAIEDGHPATCVNVLSMVVHGGQSFLAPYSASKAALANVTKNAAQTLRHHRIRVNGINCGWMDTPGEDVVQKRFHGAGEDWREAAGARLPFGRLVDPAEVAVLAAYMLGPQSGVMTGSVVDFDQVVAGAYPE